jgi:peptide/nickel transport system substrate-binding protein
MDEQFNFNPVLAEALPESSPDGLTHTFRLVPGVTFHDGAPFTSADVKYTYEWYMDPANAAVRANDFASVATVEAPDERTVIVRMKEPNAAFFPLVATTYILPAAYHGRVGKEEYSAKPVGTGPFRLKEWRAAEYTEVEAYPEHFRGRPYLDSIRLNVVPEPSVRAIAIETGEADSTVWPLVTEDSLRLLENPDIRMYETAALAMNHFPLNHRHPILGDRTVRQAMMHAIDRQAVVDEIFSGAATIATANLSPALEAFYTPEVTEYPYDPERAATLLDEAGWTMGGDDVREKDGQRLSFVCTTVTGDQVRRPEAELVQQYLAEAGIDMQLEEAPVTTILDRMRDGSMDASLFNWTYGGTSGDPDASVELRSDGTNNFSHYNNPRIDELLDQGLRELDPAARAEIYREVQRIFAEDVPFIYMMFWDIYTPYRTRVQGMPEPEAVRIPEDMHAKAFRFYIGQQG